MVGLGGPRRADRRLIAVRRDGRPVVTPLAGFVLAVTAADTVFALDSVPAALSFSTVTWVVVAANAFALLGLRPLCFLVAGLVGELRYLRAGLAAILGIAGLCLALEEILVVPAWAELAAVAVVLAAYLLHRRRQRLAPPARLTAREVHERRSKPPSLSELP